MLLLNQSLSFQLHGIAVFFFWQKYSYCVSYILQVVWLCFKSPFVFRSTDNETNFSAFNLMDLLPTNMTKYFRYQGSLTTPTCNEAVTWTVFNDTVKISRAQVKLTISCFWTGAFFGSFMFFLLVSGANNPERATPLWSCKGFEHQISLLKSVIKNQRLEKCICDVFSVYFFFLYLYRTMDAHAYRTVLPFTLICLTLENWSKLILKISWSVSCTLRVMGSRFNTAPVKLLSRPSST